MQRESFLRGEVTPWRMRTSRGAAALMRPGASLLPRSPGVGQLITEPQGRRLRLLQHLRRPTLPCGAIFRRGHLPQEGDRGPEGSGERLRLGLPGDGPPPARSTRRPRGLRPGQDPGEANHRPLAARRNRRPDRGGPASARAAGGVMRHRPPPEGLPSRREHRITRRGIQGRNNRRRLDRPGFNTVGTPHEVLP